MQPCARGIVVWLGAIASVIGSNTANGQSSCPAITFLNAGTVAVRPSASSHLAILRQNDGSYTGYEIADASPYHVMGTTPHVERQFAACVPHILPTTRVPNPGIAANAPGVASQTLATALLSSGRYVIASVFLTDPPYKSGIAVDVLDGNLGLIRETRYSDLGFVAAVLFADLDGDGNPDLMALQVGGLPGSNGRGGFIWVLPGHSDGSFGEPVSYGYSGWNPNSIAAADLNGDGKPDIVVTGAFSGDGEISILLGNGDGTFQGERPIFQRTPSGSIVAADLNHDGKIDLAFLVDSDISFTRLAVAFGLGDGTFATPVPFAIAPSTSLAVGDVNGDGRLDLVTNGVTVLLGDGKGGFSNRRDYLANTGNTSVILGDFDGDGNPDIILGLGNLLFFSGHPFPPFPASTIERQAVLFGRGDGTFVAAPMSPGGGPALAADFNGDGLPDIASFDSFNRRVAILQGVGDGTFRPVFDYGFPTGGQNYPQSAVAGDFNRDGKTDLAVATTACTNSANNPGEIVILPGQGDGTLGTPALLSTAPGDPFLATGDLNGDGNADLVVVLRIYGSCSETATATDTLLVFLGDGHGGFASPTSYSAGPGASAVAIGDFNGDGKMDLVVANQGTPQNPAGNVTVLAGAGDGTFSAMAPIETGVPGSGPYRVTVTDFNKDGKLDLLVTLTDIIPGGNRGALVLIGKGDGTFQPPTLYPEVPFDAIVGDLNSDGAPDLIFSNGAYRLGNGDGTFRPVVTLQGTGAPAVIVADFNGDGKPDMVGSWPNQVGGSGPVTLLNTSPPANPLAIVSAASFASGPVAADSIASAFGTHLATATASAQTSALPTVLASTTVTVQDKSGAVRGAHLFYVSPTQVNLVIPAGTGNGTATVTILSGDGQTATAHVEVASVAPALFTMNASGLAAAYVIHVKPGNVQTTEFVFAGQAGSATPVAIDLGPPTDQAYLALFGTGIRNAGAVQVTVKVNGLDAQVSYAGPQPQFAGLDQVNVRLPHALAGSGDAALVLTVAGTVANTVHLTFK
jgi:uncharacterized protein (TIGR03437 family)